MKLWYKDTLRISNDLLCPSVDHASQITFTLYAKA